MSIREAVDGGQPTLVSDPKGAESEIYRSTARQVVEALKARSDAQQTMPNISINQD